jgi:phosphoglycerate dehydrogenase-like enzyme
MPRKVRQLIAEAERNVMEFIHRLAKVRHPLYEHKASGTQVYISGHTGADAQPYQERDVREALEKIRRWKQEREA